MQIIMIRDTFHNRVNLKNMSCELPISYVSAGLNVAMSIVVVTIIDKTLGTVGSLLPPEHSRHLIGKPRQ